MTTLGSDSKQITDDEGRGAVTLNTKLPELPLPPPPSVLAGVRQFLIHYVVFPALLPLFSVLITVTTVKRKQLGFRMWRDLYAIVSSASDRNSIEQLSCYQDATLLSQVYQQPSARHYLQQRALEYQVREGYCAGATLRCLLGSFAEIPPHTIPPQKMMPSHPEEWCQRVDSHAMKLGRQETATATSLQEEHKYGPQESMPRDDKKATTTTAASPNADCMPALTSTVLRGLTYPEFVAALRTHLANPHERVAVNYLRSALFGFRTPSHHWFFQKLLFIIAPFFFFTGLFGGHFSPIVGILEQSSTRPGENETENDDNPLVAIFDVNHKYGGTYLVPARRLYQAVRAVDITTGLPRALIVVSASSSSSSSETR